MSAIANIKKEIIRKLSSQTDFNKVYSYEKLNPAGFPAVFVTFTGTENEFFTNAENKRIYSFRVLILVPIGQKTPETATDDEKDTAERAIQDLSQEAIDAVDSDYTLGDYGQVIFVEAAFGNTGYVEYEGGWARSGEITLRVHSVYVV